MLMSESGNVIVTGQSDPEPSRPPTGPVMFGTAVLLASVLVALGFVGEPSATGDVADETRTAEVASIPSTAPTSLVTTTTTTRAPSLDTPLGVEVIALDDLAGKSPAMLLAELIQPPELRIVSHLVESQGAVYAFGPTTELGELPAGLIGARWDGMWTAPTEVVPPDELVVAVAGGDPGLVVVSLPVARTSIPFFGPGFGPTVVRTSPDGANWSEVRLVAADGSEVQVNSVVVGTSDTWLFGQLVSPQYHQIIGALPPAYADLVREGRLLMTPNDARSVGLYAASFLTEVASFRLEDLGIDEPSDWVANPTRVAIRSTDLETFAEITTDLPPVYLAFSDPEGRPYAVSDGGVWRYEGDAWDQVVDSGIEAIGNAAAFDARVFAYMYSRFGPEIRIYSSDGETGRLRFAGEQLFETGPVSPVAGLEGVLFAFAPPVEFEFEDLAVASHPNGREVIAARNTNQYQVRDADGGLIALASMWGSDRRIRFVVETETLEILDDEGVVAGTVTLQQLSDAVAAQSLPRVTHGGGFLYSDGADWSFVPMEDLPGVNDEAVGVAAAVGIDQGFIVASGPPFPWSTTDRPSRLWIMAP